MSGFRVSIQLCTIRDETERDFLGACAALASMGYRWVELAGLGGYEPADLALKLSDLGLGISGAHLPLAVLDDAGSCVEQCHALGITSATLPWLPKEMRESAECWRVAGGRLESSCQVFRDEGLRLGYHNHDFEFQEFDGKSGLEWLLGAAPTADMQLDMFWAAKAGADPAYMTRTFAGRMPSVHFKDLGADGKDIEFGSGTLDWSEILGACDDAGVDTLVLEMDTPRHAPLESARICLEGINQLLAQESRT